MKSLIFGSTAIKHWFAEYPSQPNDVDHLVSEPYTSDKQKSDVEFHSPQTSAFLVLEKYNRDSIYVDSDLLYTIKMSHLAWEGKNGKWWKHLKDSVFLRNKGCKLNQEVFDAFYKEWQLRFSDKSQISLNKAVEMFFKDGVRREFDHDWLHEHFAVESQPAYQLALIDKNSPMMSKKMFDLLPERSKLLTCLEEMFVVSFERKVPMATAYKSLATTMTKGWWNLYLLEHTEELLDGFINEKQLYKMKVEKLK